MAKFKNLKDGKTITETKRALARKVTFMKLVAVVQAVALVVIALHLSGVQIF